MNEANEKERDELADKYLVDTDWDYEKYGDKRKDRSAYDTLMNYEISENMHNAFSAGFDAGCASGEKQASELQAENERRMNYVKAFVRKFHGEKALTCDHDYEPDTLLTEMRCELCGVDMNLGCALAANPAHEKGEE